VVILEPLKELLTVKLTGTDRGLYRGSICRLRNSTDTVFMMSMGSTSNCFFLLIPFVVFSLIALAPAKDLPDTRYPQQIAAAKPPPSPANQVSLQTIEKGFRSGVLEPLQIVVRGQAEWRDLWQRHAAIKANPPLAPAIDFNKEIAAGVFLDEKPTGGYDTEIVRAERVNGTLLLSFVEKSPQPGAIVTQATTQPFHIIRVAINGTGAVGFRRVS